MKKNDESAVSVLRIVNNSQATAQSAACACCSLEKSSEIIENLAGSTALLTVLRPFVLMMGPTAALPLDLNGSLAPFVISI